MITIDAFDFNELPKLAFLLDEFVQSQKELKFKPGYRLEFGYWLMKMKNDQEKYVLAAKDDAKIIGLCVGSILANHPMLLPETYGYINIIAVMEEYRGQGIARSLLDQTTAWFLAKGISEVQMHNLTYNDAARNFWIKSGFDMIMDRRAKYL